MDNRQFSVARPWAVKQQQKICPDSWFELYPQTFDINLQGQKQIHCRVYIHFGGKLLLNRIFKLPRTDGMSINEVEHLVFAARSKLFREMNRDDWDLRHIVGHANLLRLSTRAMLSFRRDRNTLAHWAWVANGPRISTSEENKPGNGSSWECNDDVHRLEQCAEELKRLTLTPSIATGRGSMKRIHRQADTATGCYLEAGPPEQNAGC